MECQRCGRSSEEAPFCTWCGTRQGASKPSAAGRRGDRFAAHPGEVVLQPSVLTTIFPHLGRQRVGEFEWALLVGLGLIVLLYFTGFIAAAILMAAVLVPILYVMYLYDARVYRDTPIPVLGWTLGAGAVLGVIVTVAINSIAPATPLVRSSPFGPSIDTTGLLVFLIGVPILIEIIKPLPTLILRRSKAFPESIDGLVFGIAAGLGYAAAETIVHTASVIADGGVRGGPGNWIYELATIAIFSPLLHGSTTGLIVAALWRRGDRMGLLGIGGVAAALLGHIAFAVGSELLGGTGQPQLIVLGWQALVVATLLLAVRLTLHKALLEEASVLGLATFDCPNCDSHVTAAGFCPVCGMALSASPKPAKTQVPPARSIRAEGT